MSLSARERDNPPPRRKSCSACIKAKRRCEYGAPACARCAQRNLRCDYPLPRGPSQPMQNQRGTTPQRVSAMLSGLAEDRSLLETGGLGDVDFAALLSPPDETGEGPLPEPDSAGKDYAPFGLENMDLPLGSLDGLGGFEAMFGGGLDGCDAAAQSLVIEDHSVPDIDFTKPAPLGTLTAPASKDLQFLSTMIQERLEFSLEVIQSAPRTMVHNLETPWSHPLLYREHTPKAIQDAISSCALYLAKNPVNAPVVFTLIDARANDLLSSPAPTTLRDALAHTHALHLYQIMCLFDGDISARARGERLIPALEASTMQLLAHVRFDSELLGVADLPPFPVAPARDLWHRWLLHESARRTALITFYLLQVYWAMAGRGAQAARCVALCHSWTLSRGLWEARSAVQFAEVWRRGRWFVITNRRIGDALAEVTAEDVDVFGRMWITALMGIEETEGWFAAKGGSLREKEEGRLVC